MKLYQNLSKGTEDIRYSIFVPLKSTKLNRNENDWTKYNIRLA